MPFDSDLDQFGFLAREAAEQPGWREFATFAELRGKGMRRPAFQALTAFLRTAEGWPYEEQLVFVRWLLGRSLSFQWRPKALPQPLYETLLVPVVRRWAELEPKLAEPRLWLGLLRCDDPSAHLERALELDPSCARARWTLAHWIAGDVEYNQHHMPAFYIHDPRDDLVALDRLDALIGGDPQHADAAILRRDSAELRRVAEAWLAEHPREGDFAER